VFAVERLRLPRGIGFLICGCVLLAAYPASLQEAPPAAALAGEAYRLGPGDVVEVVVGGVEELALQPSEKGIIIGLDGCFMYPYADVIAAQGKTCSEVAAIIHEALSRRYQNFSVSVRVQALNAQRINVLGAVNQPGSFPYEPELLIRDAIARAGGAVLDGEGAASQVRARLVSATGESETIDLQEALQGVGEYGTRVLEPGDTLVVEQEATVSVLGYVRLPGHFKVKDGTRLSDAIALAGGAMDEQGTQRRLIGDLSRVTINRPGAEMLEVDLTNILGGEGQEDPILLPGDLVYVPPSDQVATIVGYVRQPGKYSFQEGERVSDIIALSGGEVVQVGAIGGSRGDLRRVVLARADGTRLTLDQSRLAQGDPDGGMDPILEPGDTIFVPEERLEVSVLGHVVAQGRYPLRPDDRVADALANAGGPLQPREIPAATTGADLANCVLYRANGDRLLLDLTAFSANRPLGPAPTPDRTRAELDIINNPPLEHGDTLVVPEADSRVRVDGYVTRPGYFEYRAWETISQAIAMAGGPLRNVGSESLAVLRYPNGAEEEIDIRRDDRVLSAGLSIYIPYARYNVAVLGYVALPGLYEWHEGDTVVDMIAQARGPLPPRTDGGMRILKGEYYRAILIRRIDGKGEYFDLDLKKYYENGDLAANPKVLPDDVIMVPQKDKLNPQTILQDIFALPGVLNNIFFR